MPIPKNVWQTWILEFIIHDTLLQFNFNDYTNLCFRKYINPSTLGVH